MQVVIEKQKASLTHKKIFLDRHLLHISAILVLRQVFFVNFEQFFENTTSIRFWKSQLGRSVPPLPDTGIISYLKMIFWLFLQFLCKDMFFSRNCVHIGLLY